MPDSSDPLTVHPLLHPFTPSKTTTDITFQLIARSDAPPPVATALASLSAMLTTQRAALLSALRSSPPEAVLNALRAYLSHISLLSIDFSKVHLRTSTEGMAQVRAQQVSTLLCASSPMRGLVTVSWSDVLLTRAATNTASDALFELASVLIAVATWLATTCATLCQGDARPHESVQAYGLLRQAAGLFQAAETTVLPLLGASSSADCHLGVVRGMTLHCMAEAQGITVLRAIKKGNQPGLVAGLAADTAALYRDAHKTLAACGYAHPSTCALLLYVQYQAHCFDAYQHCFAGLVQLGSKEAGKAVRCMQEAAIARAHAATAGAAYGKTTPSTNQARARYEQELDRQLEAATSSAQHASKAYLQHVPKDAPEPPPPQRLVTVLPLVWPDAPDDVVKHRLDLAVGGGAPRKASSNGTAAAVAMQPLASGAAALNGAAAPATAGADTADSAAAPAARAAWWRWLLVAIALPLLVVVSLVGVVVWLVLLPVKILCCPLGCAAQVLVDVVEWVVKAPLRGMLWASGKPWKPASVAPALQSKVAAAV